MQQSNIAFMLKPMSKKPFMAKRYSAMVQEQLSNVNVFSHPNAIWKVKMLAVSQLKQVNNINTFADPKNKQLHTPSKVFMEQTPPILFTTIQATSSNVQIMIMILLFLQQMQSNCRHFSHLLFSFYLLYFEYFVSIFVKKSFWNGN